jgi:small-conductance mechanosensitive channel
MINGRQPSRPVRIFGVRCLAFALLLCALSFSQEQGIPVTIDGREVVRVYGSLGSFSAQERADAIHDRILRLAKVKFTEQLDTREIPSQNATAVYAGQTTIMAVTQLDAELAGMPRQELAKQYSVAIRKAIDEYRVRHTWNGALLALLETLFIWAVYCTGVWALLRAVRWIDSLSAKWVSTWMAERLPRGAHRVLLDRGRALLLTTLKGAAGILLLFVFSFAISYTFSLYPATAGISTTVLDYLLETFSRAGWAVLNYLPSGGFVIIVCLVTYYLLRVLRFLSRLVEAGDLSVGIIHPEMARPTYQLARFVVILFALVVAFPYLPGGKSDAFKGVTIFLGLLLSLGSSSAVTNVLAGLVLTYMRAFRIGDRVKIADTVGDVIQKSLLVTRIRTIKNVEVVIPNGAILTGQVLNYSAMARSSGLILHTTVTIGYDAPWRKVHDLLIQAALTTNGVLSEPKPFVLETGLNDFHISYELNVYTDRPQEIQNIYSGLHQAIQDSFNEGGVEIMSPSFYALRDGNTLTIPASHRPAGYEAPSFRVRDTKPSGRGAANRAAGGL